MEGETMATKKGKAKKQETTTEAPKDVTVAKLPAGEEGDALYRKATDVPCEACGVDADIDCRDMSGEGFAKGVYDDAGNASVHQVRLDAALAAARREELKAGATEPEPEAEPEAEPEEKAHGSKAEVVFDVAAKLGGPLVKEKDWLYFLDANGNIARSKVVGSAKKRPPPEVVIETGITKEDGWLYFINKQGNVARVPMSKSGHSPQLVDEQGRVLFERELPVPLTDEELKERGQELAEKMSEVDQAEQARKDAAAAHKAIVERLTGEASDMARVIRAGKVNRSVKCYTEHDLEKEVARVVRCDTGEVVETRTLSRDELADLRQQKLFKEPAAETYQAHDSADEVDEDEPGAALPAPEDDFAGVEHEVAS